MMHDRTVIGTECVLPGESVKAIVLNRGVPSDVASRAKSNFYFSQYFAPTRGLNQPPDAGLAFAFGFAFAFAFDRT